MPIRKVGSEMPISEIAWNSFAKKRIAPERGINPHQDAEHQRQDSGAGGEFQRRRHPFFQEVGDRQAELIGDAELELRGIGEIAERTARQSGSSSPSDFLISARSAAEVSIETIWLTGSPTKRNIENAMIPTAIMTPIA